MKRVLAIGMVLVALLVVALAWRVRMQGAAAEGPPGGAGVIEGTDVAVAARVSGRITELLVREGVRVQAGDPIAELDCQQERARLAEADARVEAARAQVAAADAQVRAASRGRGAAAAAARAALARAGAMSTEELSAAREADRVVSLGSFTAAQTRDITVSRAAAVEHEAEAARANSVATRAQVGVASAQIDAAGAQTRAAVSSVAAAQASREVALVGVAECSIRAPRDGYVEELYYEEGELIAPGGVLLRLVDLRDVRATFYLPNAELAAARMGRRAEVVADAWPGERFLGEVITVAAEAEFTPRNIQTRSDRDRLVYPIEVRVPNLDGRLRPGMPVQVTLLGGDGDGERDEARP